MSFIDEKLILMATSAVERRPVPRLVWMIALVVLVGSIAAAIGVAFTTGSGTEQSKGGPSKPPVTTPTTQAPPTTTEPPTTTVPTTTLAPLDDRLSAASRLGYAGLGPIKLGMTLADAEQAGDVTIVPGDCPWVLHPGSSSGLAPVVRSYGPITGYTVWVFGGSIDEIDVSNPATFTISGVHVGDTYDDVLRTYPSAVEKTIGGDPDGSAYLSLTIANPEGRVVVFFMQTDRVVHAMTVAYSTETIEGNAKC